MRRILIADEVHTILNDRLEAAGFEIDYRPTSTRDEIRSGLKDAIGLVIRSKTFVDEDLLLEASHMRFVARAGAGVDNVDEAYLQQQGIALHNAPEGNRGALGEHAVGMLLALLNKMHTADREVRAGQWRREPNRGYELGSLTVGILGYGYMGSATAEKLQGFGCRVLAYDKLVGYNPRFAQEVDWATFLSETEVLSIHVPLTDETNRLVSSTFLSRFPKLKFVMNTARGEILVLEDLADMLESGQLKGAVLDVLENEKIKNWTSENHRVFDRLKMMDNVIFTPHVGGWTFESYRRISDVLADKILGLQLE